MRTWTGPNRVSAAVPVYVPSLPRRAAAAPGDGDDVAPAPGAAVAVGGALWPCCRVAPPGPATAAGPGRGARGRPAGGGGRGQSAAPQWGGGRTAAGSASGV